MKIPYLDFLSEEAFRHRPVPLRRPRNIRRCGTDKAYEYNISLWETSYVFKAGHRIRLEISSSNFPRFARNQNIGEPLGTSDKIVAAKQTVYHNVQHASHLVLPVIPDGNGI